VARGVHTGLVVLALAAGLVVPAAADELDDARDQLSGARAQLDDVERTVQRTGDEVAAADERLRGATTQLHRVREELAGAEVAMEAAVDTERTTAAALAEADALLEASLDTWGGNRERLEARAVSAYKHGGRAAHRVVLVRGVTGAGDWHEVAVTVETVERLLRSDRELVDDTAAATRAMAEARGEVTAARSAAVAAQRTASQERRRVAQLVDRQERVVAEVDHEVERRRAALARLEDDASARAVLVRDLEARVERLELARLPVTVPVVQVDLDAQGPVPDWATRLPAGGRDWAAAIDAAAAAHGLDGRLLAAVVWTESNFRPEVVSHAGAIGLAQLMPGTARGLGVDPRDPLANLSGGAAYLRAQLDRFGRADLGLAAYNAGPARVATAGPGVPNIVETQLYVVRVLERYEQLRGS
jgi:soluble lytic murein transglycosylase-like protein